MIISPAERPQPQWKQVVSAGAMPFEAGTADVAQPSARSHRGLDGITFLMADVGAGAGPDLSVFLKGGEHWDAGAIGIAMAASSIGAAVCQVPAGLLVDETRAKRFLASVVLFHFGNAAMLPMAGQALAIAHPGSDTIALSACIIAAQLVMVGIAWAVGRVSGQGIGRKPIFLLALAVLPVRGVLFSFTTSPIAVVGIQLLDGLAAGIFGVISVLIASDLMRGIGRFNFAKGLVALSGGIGAALSNATAGYVVQWFGYPVGFLFLAGIAGVALASFAALMPETKSMGRP